MRLDEQLSQPQLTEGVAALEHFTDREEAIDAFKGYLAASEGTFLPIINFYGVGGSGKSLLLRKLHGSGKVPFVHLDLNEERLRERLASLTHLRVQLAEAGIDCPEFDLHRTVLMAKEGGSEEELFKINPVLLHLFNGLTGGFVGPAAGFTPLAKDLTEKMGPKAEEFLRKIGGTKRVLELRRYEPSELADKLPKALAQDLAAHLPKREGCACRGVIFIDSFEKLWEGRQGPHLARDRNRDLWLRQFFMALCCSKPGVLLVISGRDELHWPDTDRNWRAMTADEVDECLETHLLGGLSPSDTQCYLAGCKIGPTPDERGPNALQVAIIDCCSRGERAKGCLPLFVGLCAEIVLADPEGADADFFTQIPGNEVATRLANRFLTSVADGAMQELLNALGICRWFDVDLLEARGYNKDEAANTFKVLRAYSFTNEQDGGRLTLHPVMRDALHYLMAKSDDEDAIRKHHTWFREYFQQRVAEYPEVEAEAWYHHLHEAPAAAVQQWRDHAEQATQKLDAPRGRELLTWWEGLDLTQQHWRDRMGDETWAGALHSFAYWLNKLCPFVLAREGLLMHAIDCYNAALRVRTEEQFPAAWAMTQNNLGIAYSDLPTGDRTENLQQAIECYTAALRVYTEEDYPADWAETQNNLGNAYSDLPTGEHGANLQQAIECYTAALRVYTEEDYPADWAETTEYLALATDLLRQLREEE